MANYCPYVGLVPFSRTDAGFFFGRERETQVISLNLQASRCTLIYGASGVGKTSILRAGVENKLRKEAFEDISRTQLPRFLPVVFSSWREDPVHALQTEILATINELIPGHQRDLSIAPEKHLKMNLQSWTTRLNCVLLLILDQFEEYFVYHSVKRSGFADQLAEVIITAGLPANFVISIRDDSLAGLDIFEGKIPSLFRDRYSVKHLSYEQAYKAITKPVEEYNRRSGTQIAIADDLVRDVLAEIKTGKLFLGAAGRGYQPIAELAPEEAGFEAPFLQLVMTRLWEHSADKNCLDKTALTDLKGVGEIVRTHLNDKMKDLSCEEMQFSARIFNRLVTPSGKKVAHSFADLVIYADGPHEKVESLLQRLSDAPARILTPISVRANGGEEKYYEITHDILAPPILNWSSAYRIQRELAEAHRKLQEQIRAERVSFSRELAAAAMTNLSVDPERSLLLSLYASTLEAELKHMPPADAGATGLFAEAEDALFEALQTSRVRQRFVGNLSRLSGLAYDGSKQQLATVSEDGTARIWELRSGKQKALFEQGQRWLYAVAFAPDGARIATAGEDGYLLLWDVATGALSSKLKLSEEPLYCTSFDPSGKHIAAGGQEGKVWIVSLTENRIETTIEPQGGSVNATAFSPDSAYLAFGGEDAIVRVWNKASGGYLEMKGHQGWIKGLAFSPDRRLLASASHDGTARVWQAPFGSSDFTLWSGFHWVTTAAFSPDSRLLATGGTDNRAVIWDVARRQPQILLAGHEDAVRAVAFTDERHIATASSDKTARVWQVGEEQSLMVEAHKGSVNDIAFSPDGKFLASAAATGRSNFGTEAQVKCRTASTGIRQT